MTGTIDAAMANVTAPMAVRDTGSRARAARQHIRFAFYRVRPEWRLRSGTDRAGDRGEVAARVREFGERPGMLLNTTYSVGLGGQEFVVAFEGDSVADFLDLVQEMRESEASTHTVRDVPSFTCISMDIDEVLAALG